MCLQMKEGHEDTAGGSSAERRLHRVTFCKVLFKH